MRQHLDRLESSSRSARDLANVATRAADEADKYALQFTCLFDRLQVGLSGTGNVTPEDLLRVFLEREPTPKDLRASDPKLLKLMSNLINQKRSLDFFGDL